LYHAFATIRGIEYVVHLAADRKPDAPWESVLKNNIVGTRNVYEYGQNHGVEKIIFASSTYATRGYREISPTSHKEQHPGIIFVRDPIRPDSDYATSKALGEALGRQ
jgi:nucleoside-diphosphate-sugar epimerase